MAMVFRQNMNENSCHTENVSKDGFLSSCAFQMWDKAAKGHSTTNADPSHDNNNNGDKNKNKPNGTLDASNSLQLPKSVVEPEEGLSVSSNTGGQTSARLHRSAHTASRLPSRNKTTEFSARQGKGQFTPQPSQRKGRAQAPIVSRDNKPVM